MLPEQLQQFADTPLKVLNDGHVLLVDVMGDEQAIIDAARVSFGKGTKRVLEDRGLIRYLMRHYHTTPLEMCELKIRIRIPMDAWRQMVRHRTANINEYSTRYSEAIDSMADTDDDAWRLQSTDNKQGSKGYLSEWPGTFESIDVDTEVETPGEYLSSKEEEFHRVARELYEERLSLGIAKEQARKDLPLSTYTEAYWKCDLHNLLNFLRLRLAPDAQLEIRLYAQAMAEIVKVWVPMVWEAFMDYTMQSMKLSRMESVGIAALLQDYQLLAMPGNYSTDNLKLLQTAVEAAGLKGREADEFTAKLRLLMMMGVS